MNYTKWPIKINNLLQIIDTDNNSKTASNILAKAS